MRRNTVLQCETTVYEVGDLGETGAPSVTFQTCDGQPKCSGAMCLPTEVIKVLGAHLYRSVRITIEVNAERECEIRGHDWSKDERVCARCGGVR